MLDPDDLRAAAAALRRLLAAVEAGEVDAGRGAVAHLRGSVEVLEQLTERKPVRQPDV